MQDWLKVVVYLKFWWKSSNALVLQLLVSSCGLWHYRGFARHGASTLCQQQPASHLAYLYHNLVEPCHHPTRGLDQAIFLQLCDLYIHYTQQIVQVFLCLYVCHFGQTISAKEIASCIQSHVILQENAIYELLLQLLQKRPVTPMLVNSWISGAEKL